MPLLTLHPQANPSTLSVGFWNQVQTSPYFGLAKARTLCSLTTMSNSHLYVVNKKYFTFQQRYQVSPTHQTDQQGSPRSPPRKIIQKLEGHVFSGRGLWLSLQQQCWGLSLHVELAALGQQPNERVGRLKREPTDLRLFILCLIYFWRAISISCHISPLGRTTLSWSDLSSFSS